MFKQIIPFTLLIGFMLCGCDPRVPTQPDSPQARSYAEEYLPAGAKNIVNRGNNWVTFDLEIDGRVRRFLFKRVPSGGSNDITELKD